MKFQTLCMGLPVMLGLLIVTAPADARVGQPATAATIRAMHVAQNRIDCSAHQDELCKLCRECQLDEALLRSIEKYPTLVDADLLRSELTKAMTALKASRSGCKSELCGVAERGLALCEKTRESSSEYQLSAVDTSGMEGVTRAPTTGATWSILPGDAATYWGIAFDTTTLTGSGATININQDLGKGASVSFNGVTSATGSALALDAASGQNVTIGGTHAAQILIGNDANTTTIDLSTAKAGSNAYIDALTVTIGDTNATTVNVGGAATTTIKVAGDTAGTGNAVTVGTALSGSAAVAETITIGPAITTSSGAAVGTIDIGVAPGTNATETINVGYNSTAATGTAAVNIGSKTTNSTVSVYLGSPTAPTQGQYLGASGTNNELSWQTISPASHGNALDVTMQINQPIGTTSAIAVAFDQASFSGMPFDIYSYQATIPATGYYLVNGQVEILVGNTGTKNLTLYDYTNPFSPAYIAPAANINIDAYTVGDHYMLNMSGIAYCTAGDLVELQYTASGAGDEIQTAGSHWSMVLIAS